MAEKWYNPATWTRKGVQNTAAELFGINDIKKGVSQISKSGILPGGKKADFGQFAKGLGQTALGGISFIPGAGTVSFAGRLAGKGLAKKAPSAFLKAAKPINKIATPTLNKLESAGTKLGGTSLFKSIRKIEPKTIPGKLGKFGASALTSPLAASQLASELLFPETPRKIPTNLINAKQSFETDSSGNIVTNVYRKNPLRPNSNVANRTQLKGDSYVLVERTNPLRPNEKIKTYVKESQYKGSPTGKIVGYGSSINRINPLTGKLEQTIVSTADRGKMGLLGIPKPISSPSSTYQVPKVESQFVPKQTPQQPPVTQQPPTTDGGFTGTGDWRMGEEKDRQTTTQPPVTQELPPVTTPTFGNLPYENLPYTVTTPGTPTIRPSDLAAGESGAIGAASIASQMAGAPTTAPTPVSTVSEEGVNLSTMDQPRMTPMLGAAQVANAQYLADLAALASRSAAADAGLRERFSQNIMGARGGAADIIGGRAPAILGQAVTGARRDYTTGQSAQALSDLAEQEALRRTYSRSIQSAYKSEADKILKDVKERSQLAAQIRGIGVA